MENEEKIELLKALDNENNSTVINLNTRKIKAMKNDMLQKLQLSSNTLKQYHIKLANYRYVDDLEDIQYGCYIRWIPLRNPEVIKLTNGGIIVDIKILENGIHIVCKNNMNRIFQIKFDECMIFQKLTNQENVIISVLDYIAK
tara:strand:- start:1 stop:429 length:429 start_codon:yes stop_codon:yes gene_type:complete